MDFLQALKGKLKEVETALMNTTPGTPADFKRVYQQTRQADRLRWEREQLRQLIEVEISTTQANHLGEPLRRTTHPNHSGELLTEF